MIDLEMLCRYANSDDDLPPDITRDVVAEIGELRFENQRLSAENAALKEAQRWIPVGERLPDDYERVLILDGTNNTRHLGYICLGVSQWCTVEGVSYHGETYRWITHWMEPLAPPEDAA